MSKLVFIFSILGIFCQDAQSGERIVDEETIKEWGYRTVSIEENQFIKKIDKVNKTGPAYYPRFRISKKCYETGAEAEAVIESIRHLQKTEVRHRDYDYRMGVVQHKCLYILNTEAMFFKLEYQPGIFELLRDYISTREIELRVNKS